MLRLSNRPCRRGILTSMAFHHVALASKDLEATHQFYTEVMGFTLVKTVIGPVPGSDGWSKHIFFDTGSEGMIAFWGIHDRQWPNGYPTNLNETAGLPGWVNHFAYNAPTREDLDNHRITWTNHGHTVIEVDHEFCVSIYTSDPDGNTVEFCHNLREFTAEEKTEALRLLKDPHPAMDKDAKIVVHPPTHVAATN